MVHRLCLAGCLLAPGAAFADTFDMPTAAYPTIQEAADAALSTAEDNLIRVQTPQLFPTGRSEALAPGEPLSPQPNPS